MFAALYHSQLMGQSIHTMYILSVKIRILLNEKCTALQKLMKREQQIYTIYVQRIMFVWEACYIPVNVRVSYVVQRLLYTLQI